MPAYTVREARIRLAKWLQYAEQIDDGLLMALWHAVFPEDKVDEIKDGMFIYNEPRGNHVG